MLAGVFRQAHADGHGDLLEAATINAALAVPGRTEGQALYVNASARALTSGRFWAELPDRLDGTVVELTEDLEHVDGETLTEAWRGCAHAAQPSRWTTSEPAWASSTEWLRCVPTSSRRTARWSRAARAAPVKAPYCEGW